MFQRQHIAVAMIAVLLLGLIGAGLGLLATPAAASSSIHQRPTVEPPRPTVPPWEEEEEEDEEEEIYPEPPDDVEGGRGEVPPHRKTGDTTAEEGAATDDEDAATDDEDAATDDEDVATDEEDVATDEEVPLPASLPNTSATGALGFPLFVGMGGIALGAGIALRLRSRR